MSVLPPCTDAAPGQVAVLTGGGDRPYALGLAQALMDAGVRFDFVGSDDLETPWLMQSPLVRFLNLRGDQRPDAAPATKLLRLAKYYFKLIRYAAGSTPPIFHILWNNKIETFDRTVLQLLYRLKGRRVVLTVHNVNREARDGKDSMLNRLTLRIQYRLTDHLFVHTNEMKRELEADYGVPASRISVIPFGINSTVPNTALTRAEARKRLGLPDAAKIVLFFGNIAPYKGVEYLVGAFQRIADEIPECMVLIAGRPKGSESYWAQIDRQMDSSGLASRIVRRIEYVPDEETEVYFKAADVLALPYVSVFQSGVLFLAYNFGLPVIATDVGALKDDVVEGMTGFVCKPTDEASLAETLIRFFSADVYRNGESARSAIRRFGHERHSWEVVAQITTAVYASLESRDAAMPPDVIRERRG
jgi:glycosyltransferase involved in cell wall biosynthesis